MHPYVQIQYTENTAPKRMFINWEFQTSKRKSKRGNWKLKADWANWKLKGQTESWKEKLKAERANWKLKVQTELKDESRKGQLNVDRANRAKHTGNGETNLLSFPEAEFLDVFGTKAVRVFLLAIHSHLYKLILLPAPKSPKVPRLCPETSTNYALKNSASGFR
jgi:hypothetical protein